MIDEKTAGGVWCKDASVYVIPDHDTSIAENARKWAVLEVHPRFVDFYIGWRTDQSDAEFYNKPVTTIDAKFAMQVWPDAVHFVARPVDGKTHLVIELVELVHENDERYANLPRY
jgi:hypothetical protein